MPPEVPELSPLARDEGTGRRDLSRLPRLGRAVILGESNADECRAESFKDQLRGPLDSVLNRRPRAFVKAVPNEMWGFLMLRLSG